jgi:beta-aspartyl-peptidase (threonine type)
MPDTQIRKPALIVHGGAWDMPQAAWHAHRLGCEAALAAGLAVLDQGGSALDSVEAAVRVLEDDPTFDAGRGSFLTSDGTIEMDAGLMDGATLEVGAVGAVGAVRHPITLARRVLESEHCLIVGAGALKFARAHGVETCDSDWLITDKERARWQALQGREVSAAEFFAAPKGTVGAVALDRHGNLAAATSTGGTPGKPPGRIGDSPIPGAGYYAENGLAAASATGWGEAFLRLLVSARACERARSMSAAEACAAAIDGLGRLAARGGLVMVDADGRVGFAFNTTAMAFAYRDDGGTVRSGPGARDQNA